MSKQPRPVVVGCRATSLSAAERDLFSDLRPFGLILFRRNCDSPDQIIRLVADFRAVIDAADAPVLIDQEGGRVARLKAPPWYDAPPASIFGDMALLDADSAREAVWLNARLIAADLAALGISVNCAPCIDVPVPGSHDVIGDRAFGPDPALVADLGAEMCRGLKDGGVVPVIKHIPGHGRARCDSHEALPRIASDLETLAQSDFVPFKALAGQPLAMTAHVVYSAIDPDNPATQSKTVIAEIIRGQIGFDGLLLSDDIGMKALSGDDAERAGRALAAGCDLVLHCSGELSGMQRLLEAVPAMTAAVAERARKLVRPVSAGKFDAAKAKKRLDRVLRQS